LNYTSDNPEAKAFINNVNFRKALYHGIDRAKLLELVNPYEPEALLRNTIIPEGVVFDEKGKDYTDYPSLSELKNSVTFDRDLAQEYFAKAVKELVNADGSIKGVEAGKIDMKPIADFEVDGKLPLQLVYIHSTDPTDTKTALLLQEMLRDTFDGQVELVLGQYVDDKYNDTIEPRRFDMLYDSFSFKYADPMAQLGRLVTDGSVNDGQYSNTEFDNLVTKASEKNLLSQRKISIRIWKKHSEKYSHQIKEKISEVFPGNVITGICLAFSHEENYDQLHNKKDFSEFINCIYRRNRCISFTAFNAHKRLFYTGRLYQYDRGNEKRLSENSGHYGQSSHSVKKLFFKHF
jgi:hypothetical protein